VVELGHLALIISELEVQRFWFRHLEQLDRDMLLLFTDGKQ